MKNFLTFLIMTFILTLFLLFSSQAADISNKKINENAGTSSAQILKISVGAKAVGMGESNVAVADDVYASYWNPAGLSYVETSQIGFMHNEWFEDIRYEFLGYVQPLRDFATISGSIAYINMGELDKTDEAGNDKGKFNPYDILLALSIGKRLNESIALGFNFKFLQENIDEESAQSFSMDIGGLYLIPNSKLILGFNIQHIGPKMKFIDESFSLPLNVKLGGSYKLIGNSLILAADLNRPKDGDINTSLGMEYKVMGIVNLRAGYRYSMGGNDLGAMSGLRTGIGIEIRDYKLDYAFVPYGELGQTHRISLLASF